MVVGGEVTKLTLSSLVRDSLDSREMYGSETYRQTLSLFLGTLGSYSIPDWLPQHTLLKEAVCSCKWNLFSLLFGILDVYRGIRAKHLCRSVIPTWDREAITICTLMTNCTHTIVVNSGYYSPT